MEKKEINNTYQLWVKERERVLNEIPVEERELAEKIIKKKLHLYEEKIRNNKDVEHFFNLDFFQDEIVKKYFKVIVSVSPRNTGKSTAVLKMLKKSWEEKQERFAIYRNTDIEVRSFVDNSMAGGWLKQNEWSATKSNPMIFDKDKNWVGSVIPLSTAYKQKSIEYEGLHNIFFEEFISDKNINSITSKLIQTTITLLRNRKANLYFAANYGDETHPIFEFFGYDGEKKLIFNWLMKTIIWNVPADLFNVFVNTNSLSYRLALGDFEVFKSQYVAKSINVNKLNLLKNKNLDDLYYCLTWEFDDLKIVIEYDFDSDIYVFRKFMEGYDDNKRGSITHLEFVKLFQNHNSVVVNEDFFDEIIELWIQEKILCLTASVRKIVVNQLSIFARKKKLLIFS